MKTLKTTCPLAAEIALLKQQAAALPPESPRIADYTREIKHLEYLQSAPEALALAQVDLNQARAIDAESQAQRNKLQSELDQFKADQTKAEQRLAKASQSLALTSAAILRGRAIDNQKERDERNAASDALEAVKAAIAVIEGEINVLPASTVKEAVEALRFAEKRDLKRRQWIADRAAASAIHQANALIPYRSVSQYVEGISDHVKTVSHRAAS